MQGARFHIHNLVKFLCSLNRLGRDEQVIFPQKVKEILGYWLQSKNYIAVSIQSHNSELTVFSDASKKAWGGVVTKNFQTQSFERTWSPEVRRFHINVKELKAVSECLVRLPEDITNSKIE